MKKLIPGSNNVYITENGIFLNRDGSQCNVIRPQQDYVIISLYGKQHTLYIPWLIDLAMTESNFRNAVKNIEFVKYRLSSHHPICTFTKFRTPVWYDETHRIVPGYSTVAVDKNGHCISSKTGNPYSIQNGQYLRINTYDPIRNKYRSIILHLLVALAWVDNDNPEEKVVVDHIDGNKHHNFYTNLEWVTQQENIKRATRIGLNPASKKCKIRNVYTHKEYTFSSIQEMLEFLEIPVLASLVNSKPHRLHGKDKNYEVRIEPDDRPWYYKDKFKRTNNRPRVSRFIINVDECSNGNIKSFHGTFSLSKYYKIWSNVAKKVNEITDIIKSKYPSSTIEIIDTFNNPSIEIKDLNTGDIKIFDNTRDAAAYTGRAQSSLLNILKNPDCDKNKYSNYVIRYKSDKPWIKESELIDAHKYKNIEYEVEHKSTGEIKTYPSLRAVASDLNRCRNFINRCIRKPLMNDDITIRVK